MLLSDYALSEPNRVHHADLFTLCNALPSQSVDMILCDLPYGTTACSWDVIIPFAPLWAAFKRVIKPRGAIVLTASQPFTSLLVTSNLEMFRYEWVWEKDRASGFLDAEVRPLKAHEAILVFSTGAIAYCPQISDGHKPANPTNASGGKREVYRDGIKAIPYEARTTRYPRSVIKFNTVNSAHNPVHPTQKPVDLFRYLIRTYTQPGELVFDPCVGSGTTALAARAEGRQFIVGDQSEEYCNIARERLRLPFEQHHVTQDNDVSGLPLFQVPVEVA